MEVPTGLVRDLTRATAAVLGRIEPRLVPLPQVTELMDAFADLERRAAAGRVLLAARAAEAGEWKRSGFANPADWLAARHGTSKHRARDDLKTSGLLDDLDDTADAFRRGDLSPEQAGAVADAAAVNPDAERDLLERAEHDSLRGLQEEAARRKAQRDDQQRKHERIRKERFCRTWTDQDGAWNLRARGPVADAAGFNAELQQLIDRRFRANRRERAESEWEGRDQYAFDTLVGLAGAESPAGAESSADANSATQATKRSSPSIRHLALIRVDLAALVRGHVTDGEVCEIAGYGPIPVAEARRLLGDSLIKLVLTNGVDVVNITHAGRGPRVAQEIALLWSQPKCCVAGCDNTRRLEIDHQQPWARNKVTALPNLNRPCDHHHDLKTYQGWDFTDHPAPDGRLVLVPPNDVRHPRNQANAPPDARAG